MKRSPLARKSRLSRRSDSYHPPRDPDPAKDAWKRLRYGRCENCGLLDDRPLHGHHVYPRQKLAQAGLPQFDPANRMDLCERCHMNHEFGQANRKIPRERLPKRAVAWLEGVLGEELAADYLRGAYLCEAAL